MSGSQPVCVDVSAIEPVLAPADHNHGAGLSFRAGFPLETGNSKLRDHLISSNPISSRKPAGSDSVSLVPQAVAGMAAAPSNLVASINQLHFWRI